MAEHQVTWLRDQYKITHVEKHLHIYCDNRKNRKATRDEDQKSPGFHLKTYKPLVLEF